jgi:NADPH:quinone reductase-like Zn-dependent oxidoreductase
VVDYRSVVLTTYLANNYSGDKSFDVIMDCIGVDAVFRASPAYLNPGGAYATIGAPTHEGLGSVIKFGVDMTRNMLLPGFLGGTPRKYEFIQVPAKLWVCSFLSLSDVGVDASSFQESTFRNCLDLIEQGGWVPAVLQPATEER